MKNRKCLLLPFVVLMGSLPSCTSGETFTPIEKDSEKFQACLNEIKEEASEERTYTGLTLSLGYEVSVQTEEMRFNLDSDLQVQAGFDGDDFLMKITGNSKNSNFTMTAQKEGEDYVETFEGQCKEQNFLSITILAATVDKSYRVLGSSEASSYADISKESFASSMEAEYGFGSFYEGIAQATSDEIGMLEEGSEGSYRLTFNIESEYETVDASITIDPEGRIGHTTMSMTQFTATVSQTVKMDFSSISKVDIEDYTLVKEEDMDEYNHKLSAIVSSTFLSL